MFGILEILLGFEIFCWDVGDVAWIWEIWLDAGRFRSAFKDFAAMFNLWLGFRRFCCDLGFFIWILDMVLGNPENPEN